VPYSERQNLKKIVDDKLIEFNEKARAQAMNIVLF
jgi:hypothetical protein